MTTLTQITSNQAGKEITSNENFAATSPSGLFARRVPGTTGLTWAYYGGAFKTSGGTLTMLANGSLSLTASRTIYIEANPTDGTVAAVPTTFTSGRIPLYKVITGTATVTSYEDWRMFTMVTA